MELKKISLSSSGLSRVRLEGEVVYGDGSDSPEVYWFDFPDEYKNDISLNGNPWVALLLPLAMKLGEPLKISLPVDAKLRVNLDKLQTIWKCWYPYLKNIQIETNGTLPVLKMDSRSTAAFFSGGVDSFFTVLRHQNDPDSGYDIDYLLTVWGFDISLQEVVAFNRMRDRHEAVAENLGKSFIDVHTNLKINRWGNALDWGRLSHGSALATVGLLFERKFKNILIASTGGYEDLKPWGSHVLTDHLFSTSSMNIAHDGAEFNRYQKAEFIASSDVAMSNLHVCYRLGLDHNCSDCDKCVRSMLMFELMGKLDSAKTFETSKFNLKKIERFFLNKPWDYHYAQLSRGVALNKGRSDVVRALDRSIYRSNRLAKRVAAWQQICQKIDRWLSGKTFIWRLRGKLRQFLFSRWGIH